jgi:rhizosphere induced protein
VTYSLTIINQSGAAQNVAVFQVNSPSTGSPLVWLSQTISYEASHSFTWDITWGLGWGTTSQPLNTGVTYQSGAQTQVYPNQADGTNELSITYETGSFMSKIAYYNSNLTSGEMLISTDQTFTVAEASNMSVAVYMYGQPILVSQGAPNSQYEFNTDTIYYLTVTDYLKGSVLPFFAQESVLGSREVSLRKISQPTRVEFAVGQTEAKYNLNVTLDFVICCQ